MTYAIIDDVIGPESYDCCTSVIDKDFLTIDAAVAQLVEYSKSGQGFSKVLYDEKMDRYFIWRKGNNGFREKLEVIMHFSP